MISLLALLVGGILLIFRPAVLDLLACGLGKSCDPVVDELLTTVAEFRVGAGMKNSARALNAALGKKQTV
jgi:hypothetical protein